MHMRGFSICKSLGLELILPMDTAKPPAVSKMEKTTSCICADFLYVNPVLFAWRILHGEILICKQYFSAIERARMHPASQPRARMHYACGF